MELAFDKWNGHKSHFPDSIMGHLHAPLFPYVINLPSGWFVPSPVSRLCLLLGELALTRTQEVEGLLKTVSMLWFDGFSSVCMCPVGSWEHEFLNIHLQHIPRQVNSMCFTQAKPQHLSIYKCTSWCHLEAKQIKVSFPKQLKVSFPKLEREYTMTTFKHKTNQEYIFFSKYARAV